MALSIIIFGVLLWLGLYLYARDRYNKWFLCTGLSLLVMAVGIGFMLVISTGNALHSSLLLPQLMLHLSFFIWLITALSSCIAEEDESQKRNVRWKTLTTYERIINALPLLVYVFICVNSWTSSWRFFFVWEWILFSLAIGVFAVHLLIKHSKAHGEAWLPDLLRSFDYTAIFTAIFSGQVAFVIQISADWNRTTVSLLLLSICISVAFQVFVYPLRALLDNIAFATFPKLREERAHLRIIEEVQVLVDDQAQPEVMDEDELYRHTRRALSQFGDLQRLASNPLTQLKLVDRRLHDRGAEDDMVERAIELKAILLENVGHLKPRQDEAFGTSDEWRYYNALYFPYVVGIKPYSVRYASDKLDAPAMEALEWFRTYVPERTYYNWQNAGARIVALKLKEKNVS